jgi:hypothetical protein
MTESHGCQDDPGEFLGTILDGELDLYLSVNLKKHIQDIEDRT